MDKRVLGQSIQTIETTVGELIEAVTQIALEAGRTEEEGYELASLTLENILRRSRCDLGAIN
jgi:hypothetical protein